MNTPRADATHGLRTTSPVTRVLRTRRMNAGLAAVLAVLTTFAALAVAAGSPASASTLNAVATIANPSGLAPLASGGSTATFTTTLPTSAACSGDTATGGYLAYSYLVHQGGSLSTLSYVGGPPAGTYGFVSNTGKYFGPSNTAVTTGQVIGIPNDFEWGPLVSTDHVARDSLLYGAGNTSGVWEAGILCAKSGSVTDNWNTEVTFTANASDPSGFTWSAVPGPSGDAFAAITSAHSATFTPGTNGSFTVRATGTPAPTFSETGSLDGLSFNATTGVLSGKPTATGTFPITFTATNGIDNPSTQSFTVKVLGFHITTTTVPPATIGTHYSVTLQATGGTAPYKWKAVVKPPKGLKVKDGLLSGTVSTKVAPGTYTFQIEAGEHTKPKQESPIVTLKITVVA